MAQIKRKTKAKPTTKAVNSRPLTPATKNEAKAKAFMLQAMARNDVMGVAFAAIEAIGDAEKWDDATELFDLSFATHEKWLESDPDYAKSVQWLEAAGLKAQRQGHWLSGLSMMGEDASVWKAMAAIFEKLDKAKPAVDAPANPYADKTLEELQEILKSKEIRVMKAVS